MSKILKLEYFKLSKEIERLQKEESKLRKEAKELKSYNNITLGLYRELEKIIESKENEIKDNLPDVVNKFINESGNTDDDFFKKYVLDYYYEMLNEENYANKIDYLKREVQLRNDKIESDIYNYENKKDNYNKKVIKLTEKKDKFIEKLINTELNGLEEYIAEKIFEVVKIYDLLKDHYWDRDKRNEIKKYVLTEGTFNIFTGEEFAILEREIFQ